MDKCKKLQLEFLRNPENREFREHAEGCVRCREFREFTVASMEVDMGSELPPPEHLDAAILRLAKKARKTSIPAVALRIRFAAAALAACFAVSAVFLYRSYYFKGDGSEAETTDTNQAREQRDKFNWENESFNNALFETNVMLEIQGASISSETNGAASGNGEDDEFRVELPELLI